jgi:hypothetical protein
MIMMSQFSINSWQGIKVKSCHSAWNMEECIKNEGNKFKAIISIDNKYR